VLHPFPLKISFILETYHHQVSNLKLHPCETKSLCKSHKLGVCVKHTQTYIIARHETNSQSHAHTSPIGQRPQDYGSDTI